MPADSGLGRAGRNAIARGAPSGVSVVPGPYARSVFWRCALSEVDPRFPKYPRLPVLECAGYERIAPVEESPDATP